MTVKQLREELARLGTDHDNIEIQVWLPGTYIRLEPRLILSGKNKATILIEGNVVEGDFI